ncbi:MAG: peptide chain release factor 2 [bacterium]|nr:peptide chain release factor 2 [bacterium]
MRELQEKFDIIKSKIPFLRDCLDAGKKTQKITELTQKSTEPDFWKDSQKAGEIMKEIESLKKEVEKIENIERETKEVEEYLNLANSKEDFKEIEDRINAFEKEFKELEFKMLLGGIYDKNDIILTIHSGAGGVDAQDWAEMLLRMYLRFAEKNNFKAKILDESRGGEAGIKSAAVEIKGDYAYGYLKGESGVHRLVRLSPFNSDHLRETSFALVEILPIISEIEEVKINPQDIRVDTFRSSGAGGQHVNTTDSAVRITHLSTGIVVSCQNERSQLQNREQSMKILKAKLHLKYLEEKENEEKKLRGEYHSAEWGNQIRSYVLHPYKMVKDHRTKQETSDAEKVLEGEIGDFIESYLRFKSKR